MDTGSALVAGLLVMGVIACGGVSTKDAVEAYAASVSDVAAAAKDDIDRCEAADGGTAVRFCERAKKHFDVIQTSAATLAGTIGDGGAK